MDYLSRQEKLAQALLDGQLDGFVVAHPPNLRYLCGYTGSNGLLVFLGGACTFFTDGRYTQQAREEVQGAHIVIARGVLFDALGKLLGRVRSAAIGFEADNTSVAAAAEMRRSAHKGISWKAISGLIMRQRIVKDADELRALRRAVKLGAEAFQRAVQSMRPGLRECEIAANLELVARQAGADGMSFETIVAGGERSALPHGRATRQPLPRRGFVVLDSGVILRGYCSDMTRTLHMGRASREGHKWYKAVLEAQLSAIAAVKAGKTAGEVDQAARNSLARAGLARHFTHSTGHGVGLEIHEPPRIGRGQEQPLQPGMVITIEPGIYVPGRGGIRIEDMVIVTATGCEVLTPVAKQLIEV